MIKWVRAEGKKDLNFNGVSIVDISPTAITLETDKGDKLRIEVMYSELRIMVPAKPKMVKKFIIKGNFEGLEFSENFDDKYTAERKLSNFPSNMRECFIIEEVEVPEEE